MYHMYDGYGGGLMSHPAPFAYGYGYGNIAGCNDMYGGITKTAFRELQHVSKSVNADLNEETIGLVGAARIKEKMRLLRSGPYRPEVINHLLNVYNGRLNSNKTRLRGPRGPRKAKTTTKKRKYGPLPRCKKGRRKIYPSGYSICLQPGSRIGRPPGSKNKRKRTTKKK